MYLVSAEWVNRFPNGATVGVRNGEALKKDEVRLPLHARPFANPLKIGPLVRRDIKGQLRGVGASGPLGARVDPFVKFTMAVSK